MALAGIGSMFSMTGAAGGNQTPDFSKSFIANGSDGKPYVKNPSKLWREVMDLKDDGLSSRKEHERLWAICWMFYKGDQWRKPAPQPDWSFIRINVGKKPKITINKILPMVQTRRAHVLKNRPTGVVMPRTIDEEDRNAARIAQDILDYDQQHLGNWDILDGKLSLTMFVTGNAFKKIYWDPTKGDKKEKNRYKVDPVTGAPAVVPEFIPGPDGTLPSQFPNSVPSQGTTLPMDVEAGDKSTPSYSPGEEDNEPMEKEGMIPNPDENAGGPIIEGTEEEQEGDVVVEFVPPEEVIPEPSATSLEDCERLLHRTLKPIKWVKDVYGEAAEDVQPINMKSDRGKALAQGAKLFGLTEREVANRVEILEAWFKPSEDYPEGLHAVWADDKMMAAGPTPDAHEFIPFVHYKEIETDEFWGISSVSQTIDPQKALNLAVSRDEFMRQRLRPKLIAATDSGIDESAYSNDDAEIVFVHHPFYPKFTEPPAFQRDEKAVGYFAQAIDDIGGSADVMRGQVNGGDIRSGRMVNYLQEYAGTVLAGPARSIEKGEEATGNMILRLRKHYTDEPRLYYIVGRNRSVEVKQFIGSDIEGCADYVVQAGSSLPMSMAEKRDLVLSLVEKGVMAPGDPRIIKMMGMPSDVDEMFNEDQLDRDNATQEDHKFLQMKDDVIAQAYGILKQSMATQSQMTGGPDPEQLGIKPQPSEVLKGLKLDPRDFENHHVHLETHNKTRKSEAYRKLTPAAQAMFDEHCDQHAMFLLPPPGPPAPPGAGGHPSMPAGPQQGGAHKPSPGPSEPPGGPGGPAALNGGKPPGGGGAGDINAEGNRERHQGMPPARRAPMNNAHHLK
jgi:hypothetical protein